MGSRDRLRRELPNWWGNDGSTADTCFQLQFKVALRASVHAPRIAWIGGSPGSLWSNAAEDTLPSSVEIDRALDFIVWQLKPELGRADARHLVFV
jgi:hypothetical protein